MPDVFKSGPDWECSSGPIITRDFELDAIWPVSANADSAGGSKDILEDGMHPVVAIGPHPSGVKTGRPYNLTGVVISYNEDADIAQVNLAEKVCVKNYVSNVDTWTGTTPYTFKTTFYIGMAVYVDDSPGLSLGVTLSTNSNNSDDNPNPLAGYLFYCQDEYGNIEIGGPNQYSTWADGTITLTDAHHQNEYCILLVNDYGTGRANLDPQG